MGSHRHHSSQASPHVWRRVILLAILVLLGDLLITQIKSLDPSLRIIRHANMGFLLLALLSTVATFFVAGLMYQLLALHRLQYGRTLLIQLASGFANRLLPAGLGGICLIAQYLRTQKHSGSEAVTVVGMDNVIGIIGHFSLFFVLVAAGNVSFTAVHVPHASRFTLLALVLFLASLALLKRVRTAVKHAVGQVSYDLKSYKHQQLQLFLAFCNSLLLTVLYVSILWASSYAVGAELPFAKVLVVFTAGSIIGNATPTPGGLVGTEAGLFSGFVAYGLSDGTALASALLYRLFTYWLPILPGVVAFLVAQRRHKLIG
jgi:uncharacterized protein (TIRG00374 family)